jgi:hypothetical protein
MFAAKLINFQDLIENCNIPLNISNNPSFSIQKNHSSRKNYFLKIYAFKKKKMICAKGAKELPYLKLVLSLNNHQNSEMNYCENMKLIC